MPIELSKNKKGLTIPLSGRLLLLVESAWNNRSLECPYLFHHKGEPIGDFRKAFDAACAAAGLQGILPHDLRRSAVRNFIRAGVKESVAIARILVDIGGGHGVLASALIQAHPHITVIVFDLPNVIEGTRKRLEVAGASDRCNVIGGSFFESIPTSGDTYILKDILHDWDDERAITILKNCRKAMSETDKLLVIERVIQTGNDLTDGKIVDITMLVMTGGRERTEAEYRRLLEVAGFELEQLIAVDADTCILTAMPRESSEAG